MEGNRETLELGNDAKQKAFVGAAYLLRHRGGEANIFEATIDMQRIEHMLKSVTDSFHVSFLRLNRISVGKREKKGEKHFVELNEC